MRNRVSPLKTRFLAPCNYLGRPECCLENAVPSKWPSGRNGPRNFFCCPFFVLEKVFCLVEMGECKENDRNEASEWARVFSS